MTGIGTLLKENCWWLALIIMQAHPHAFYLLMVLLFFGCRGKVRVSYLLWLSTFLKLLLLASLWLFFCWLFSSPCGMLSFSIVSFFVCLVYYRLVLLRVWWLVRSAIVFEISSFCSDLPSCIILLIIHTLLMQNKQRKKECRNWFCRC